MGVRIGLGDQIAFRDKVSEFETVAVVTKLLGNGWFLCYSSTQPYDLGEFALRDFDKSDLEIEVIQTGEKAVQNYSNEEFYLGQRVKIFDESSKFTEGKIVAAFYGQFFVEDDKGQRHHGDIKLCTSVEFD